MRSTQETGGGLSRWTITTGAWILAGLLIITASLIFGNRQENTGFPSITNTKPSGFAAFAELLRRDGYDLSLERSAKLDLSGADLVISTEYLEGERRNSLLSVASDDEEEAPPEEDTTPGYVKALDKFAEGGGTVLTIKNSENFDGAVQSVPSKSGTVSAKDLNKKYSLRLAFSSVLPRPSKNQAAPYVAWYNQGNPYVTFTKSGSGLLVTVADGLPITNHFLGEEQDAEFFLDLVRSLAKPGAHIKVIEAGIGNAVTPSPTNMLGQWAVFARWQAVLLFVVIVYTLGRRFGLPEKDKRSVQGTRELFDAVADVLRRSHNTGLALDNLLHECDFRIRRALHQPSTVSRANMLQLVPAPLREQYLNISELAVSKCTPAVATASAKRLLDLLQAFEADTRTTLGKKTA
ncbi:MAG TPA: hypothetical protein VNI20_06565 [Fimbriimonadaceae bacterium]|nr:hypothetical protein [Fimbriimonadaceae bacterium]